MKCPHCQQVICAEAERDGDPAREVLIDVLNAFIAGGDPLVLIAKAKAAVIKHGAYINSIPAACFTSPQEGK